MPSILRAVILAALAAPSFVSIDPLSVQQLPQIRAGALATSTILGVAAEQREQLRALTTASRMRASADGTNLTKPVVLDYELTSRGTEPFLMPDQDAPMGNSLEHVPVYLRWEPTRTTGYIVPPALAGVVPLLQDHGIAVYRLREPARPAAEVYYAADVRTNSYHQGHDLRSVEMEKQAERVEVGRGWFWIPSAQSKGSLICYLFDPETDDNLITWSWADHMLEVKDGDGDDPQRIPMIRVPQHQPLSAVLVQPFNLYQRNRFFRPN